MEFCWLTEKHLALMLPICGKHASLEGDAAAACVFFELELLKISSQVSASDC